MNRTAVLILQHRRERFHPFNTARIVNQALHRCQLMAGHNYELRQRFNSTILDDKVGILFPGDNARLLTDVPPNQRPKQLVIPDGTWHHVKTLMRDIPRLQSLPRYRLAPAVPGRYRIRREPNAHALSTLEATVAALGALEPETRGFDLLTDVFESMVNRQIQHGTDNWRQNGRRRSGAANVPRVLTGNLDGVVVAYGERERGHKSDGCRGHKPHPVYWKAVRLSSGEVFRCAIQSDSLHDQDFRELLRLNADVCSGAVSVEEFRNRWESFLRTGDRVVFNHQSTANLLQNINADFARPLILKSINVKAELPSVKEEGSRASQRLASAVALVRYLNQHYGNALC